MIVLNERHLKRLMAEYVRYYHEDRTHLGLVKDTPAGRLSADRPVMEILYDHSRDSAACIIATHWQRRRRLCFRNEVTV